MGTSDQREWNHMIAAARREGVIEGRREVCDAAARVLSPADFERLAAELARGDAPAPGCSSCGATEPHAVDADGDCVLEPGA